MKRLYLIFTVSGLILPYLYFIQFLAQKGFIVLQLEET
jgi:hypothetical protein